MNTKNIFIVIGCVVGVAVVLVVLMNKPLDQETKVFSGVVREIEGNFLVVDALSLRGVVGLSAEAVLRRVEVKDGTEIFRENMKNPALFARELEEYNKKYPDGGALAPPRAVKSKISFSEIQKGDYVTITAKNDVKKRDKVVAVNVQVNDKSTMPNISELDNLRAEMFVGKVVEKTPDSFYLRRTEGATIKEVLVFIDENTYFVRQMKKSDEQFRVEKEVYEKTKDKVNLPPPDPIGRFPTTFLDIRDGDHVEVKGIVEPDGRVRARGITALFIAVN